MTKQQLISILSAVPEDTIIKKRVHSGDDTYGDTVDIFFAEISFDDDGQPNFILD